VSTDQTQQGNTQPQQSDQQVDRQGGASASAPQDAAPAAHGQPPEDFDGLEGKKPDELTPEELRLMADTMPGEGPGD
jgi:hypothetical protein